jgi:phospholipid transport system substrate-binding protein
MKKLLFALILFAVVPTAMAQDPNDVIRSASDQLATELDGRKEALADDPDALYALIDQVLLPRFDRRYAAQLVLGRHWRNASAEQRERFIDAFYGSLRRRYADGVLEFDQEKIEVLPFRGDLTKPRTTVKTMVTLEDGTTVPVNYGMVKRESGWLMFDVTIEGISYVRNFRTELNSEIQATSLDAVIERLESGGSAEQTLADE